MNRDTVRVKNFLNKIFFKITQLIKAKGFYDRRYTNAFNFIETITNGKDITFHYDFQIAQMKNYHNDKIDLISKLADYLVDSLKDEIFFYNVDFTLNLSFGMTDLNRVIKNF